MNEPNNKNLRAVLICFFLEKTGKGTKNITEPFLFNLISKETLSRKIARKNKKKGFNLVQTKSKRRALITILKPLDFKPFLVYNATNLEKLKTDNQKKKNLTFSDSIF